MRRIALLLRSYRVLRLLNMHRVQSIEIIQIEMCFVGFVAAIFSIPQFLVGYEYSSREGGGDEEFIQSRHSRGGAAGFALDAAREVEENCRGCARDEQQGGYSFFQRTKAT